ncbi:MAG: hypothetical protein ACLQIB_43805 [Isosphaeraceae bacterium]
MNAVLGGRIVASWASSVLSMSTFRAHESAMERFPGKLLQGDRILFDEIEGAITIKDSPGLQEWRGRFWLPEGSPVEPGGKYCLVRDDERAGELILECLEPGAAEGDLAAFEGNCRFE